MPIFSFEPTEAASSEVLQAKSTFAKISFNQTSQVFQTAKLEAPVDSEMAWKAVCEYKPVFHKYDHPDETVTLYLTKGEFGRVLATVDLGSMRG